MRFLTTAIFTALLSTAAQAQRLDVPIVSDCDQSQEEAACHSGGTVMGLDPNGDGFLAVRTGPGTNYPMIDKLVNGDRVEALDRRGKWVGVLYRDGRLGWAHTNWIGNWIP